MWWMSALDEQVMFIEDEIYWASVVLLLMEVEDLAGRRGSDGYGNWMENRAE